MALELVILVVFGMFAMFCITMIAFFASDSVKKSAIEMIGRLIRQISG